MAQFEDCVCDGNISVLIKTPGDINPADLAKAWLNLFFEYCDLAEQTETKHRIKLETEIAFLERQDEIIQAWTDIISIKYSAAICEALKILGFDYDLDPEDRESYMHDVESIKADLRARRLHLKILKVEYEYIKNSPTSGETVDRKYFATMYTRINNYYKYNAVNKQTYLDMYCAMLREMSGIVKSI
jgi:hypothetical protein